MCLQGMRNPLDGIKIRQDESVVQHTEMNGLPTGAVYQYFLKVVPTTYTTLHNSTISSNQYSVTEHFREPMPGSAKQLPVSTYKRKIIEAGYTVCSAVISINKSKQATAYLCTGRVFLL